MNEQLKLLALEAGYTPDMFGVGHWDMPECKKFAELIVQECIGIAHEVGRNPFIEAYEERGKIIKKIKQHFGVEE